MSQGTAYKAPAPAIEVALKDEYGRVVLTFIIKNDHEMTELEGLPEGWTYDIV